MVATKTEAAATGRAAEPPTEAYTPTADVLETNENYVFYVDVPGATGGEVEVTYEEQTLSIEAKVPARQPAGQAYIAQQYGVGPYRRSFRLATPINAEGIRAELKDGELILTVPKAESAKTRKVAVKTA